MDFLFLETLGYESALRLSGHHYARFLAAGGHRVLSISSPVTPAHILLQNRDGSIARRLKAHRQGFAAPPIPVQGVLRHYVPFSWIPIHRRFPFNTGAALKLSCASHRGDLLKRLDRLNFTPDIISIQSMMFAPLLAAFPRSKVWYRMEDLLSGFADMPRCMVAAEAGVMDRANLITITSPVLMAAVPERHRAKTLVIPNGVDAEHFAAPHPRPAEYATITKPIALYVGALRAWFNWDWLEAAMRALPQIQFVLISPDAPRGSACAFPNFLHIPGVPYENLPACIQHAAVGIIPFIPSPLIDAVTPIKLLEFFACGKPVVSTSWRTLKDLNAPASLAATREDFIKSLTTTLAPEGAVNPEPLTKFASAHSWVNNLSLVMRKFDAPPFAPES